jgi:hypothetical protein
MPAATPARHRFRGEIVRHDAGAYRYTVVFLPDRLAARPPFDGTPRVRARGEVGGVPFAGAWQPVRGRRYLMLSKAMLRAGGFGPGDTVDVWFALDDPDAVDVPDALRRALDADPASARAWDALTPGHRRGLAHRVASARMPATIERRVAEVLDAIAPPPWR